MDIGILEDYREGLEILATARATTVGGVVNSLVYKGLREALTDEVLDSALAKHRAQVKKRLRLDED